MKPYVESGRKAQQRLRPDAAVAGEARLLSSLRGFKQVINTLGVAGILVIPLVGVTMRSAAASAIVALHFLLVIMLLELLERRVKRELIKFRDGRPQADR